MAIVGGAIMPLVQGATLDATSPAVSFIVPAVCFAVVAAVRVLRPPGRGPARRSRRARRVRHEAPSLDRCAWARGRVCVGRLLRPAGPPARNPPPVSRVVSWWTSGVRAASPQRAVRRLPGGTPRGDSQKRRPSWGGGGSNAPGCARPSACCPGTRPTCGRPSRVERCARMSIRARSPTSPSSTARGGLAAALPPVIRDGLTIDGKQYGVPTSAHRGNMLFYNLALLAKAGVAPPGAGLLDLDLPRRPGEAGQSRGPAALPGRQGPVHHHGRCSKNTPARRGRRRRVASDRARSVRLELRPGDRGATPVRPDPGLRRPPGGPR